MAAYRQLQERIAAAGATCVYLGKPPKWMQRAARAAVAGPVVVNCKGIDADGTPVLLTLAELERLQRAAAQVDALLVLMPDRVGAAADGANGLEVVQEQ